MRLALVRQRYTPFGGAERFLERALAALVAEGVETWIITRHWQGDEGTRAIGCDPFYLGRWWRDAGFARCVQAVLARQRFDLVQSHERIPGCDLYRAGDGVHATWLELRARERGGAARLAAALSPWHRHTLAAEAALLRHPRLRAVICNSQMVADDIAARFGTPRECLQVIRNGIDTDAFHPRLRDGHRERQRAALGVPEAAPLFVLVGSGFERKGVARLIGAMARMRDERAHALVVGRDAHAERYRRLAMVRGLAARVHFVGPQQDVRPFYAAADAAVLPTLYDPFPNVALEAMACGLPLVTTTTCGARELVAPGVTGYLVDALDERALAGALDELATVAGGMASAARAAAAGFTVERTAQQLIDLYRRLLGCGDRRG